MAKNRSQRNKTAARKSKQAAAAKATSKASPKIGIIAHHNGAGLATLAMLAGALGRKRNA